MSYTLSKVRVSPFCHHIRVRSFLVYNIFHRMPTNHLGNTMHFSFLLWNTPFQVLILALYRIQASCWDKMMPKYSGSNKKEVYHLLWRYSMAAERASSSWIFSTRLWRECLWYPHHWASTSGFEEDIAFLRLWRECLWYPHHWVTSGFEEGIAF
jgi:hypothetical protein